MPLNGFEKHLLSDEWSEATKEFDCGSETDNFEKLNIFLKEEGLKYNQNNLSRTNIYVKDRVCAAFYSLAMASIEKPRADKNKPNTEEDKPLKDIPTVFLTRLAVDKKYHGKKVGRAILNDIIKQVYENKEIAARFIFLDAYPESISWYLKYPLFEIMYASLAERIEDHCEKKIIGKLNERLKQGCTIECELNQDIDISSLKKNCETILTKHVNEIFNDFAPENSLLKVCHSKVKLVFEDNRPRPKIELVGFDSRQNLPLIRKWFENKDNILNLDMTIPLYADINLLYKAIYNK